MTAGAPGALRQHVADAGGDQAEHQGSQQQRRPELADVRPERAGG